jgi:hypothetical protein
LDLSSGHLATHFMMASTAPGWMCAYSLEALQWKASKSMKLNSCHVHCHGDSNLQAVAIGGGWEIGDALVWVGSHGIEDAADSVQLGVGEEAGLGASERSGGDGAGLPSRRYSGMKDTPVSCSSLQCTRNSALKHARIVARDVRV